MKMQDLSGKIAVITGASSGMVKRQRACWSRRACRRSFMLLRSRHGLRRDLVWIGRHQPLSILVKEILIRPVKQIAP
jgi:hypothetical protein